MILQGRGLKADNAWEDSGKNRADEQDVHTPSSRKKGRFMGGKTAYS